MGLSCFSLCITQRSEDFAWQTITASFVCRIRGYLNGNQFWYHLIAICPPSHARRTSMYAIHPCIISRGEQMPKYWVAPETHHRRQTRNRRWSCEARTNDSSPRPLGNGILGLWASDQHCFLRVNEGNDILITSRYWPVQSQCIGPW